MSDAARGCYSMLFAAGWDLPEPGVYPADDAVLAQLAMTTPERWATVRSEVARAFDVDNRPGWWVQKGLVRTHRSQTAMIKAQIAGGKRGAIKRWGKDLSGQPIAKPEENRRATFSPSVLGSVLGSENLQRFVSAEVETAPDGQEPPSSTSS